LKSFQFRLASVQRIRGLQLQTEESKMEQLLAQRARIESDIANLQKLLDQSWASNKSQPTLLSSELIALQRFEERVKKDCAAFNASLVTQDQLIGKQREVVVKIRRDLKLLEKLRQKRHEEWQMETDRELSALVSDITSAQWIRRQIS
jgi:flagellar export protein FliJ